MPTRAGIDPDPDFDFDFDFDNDLTGGKRSYSYSPHHRVRVRFWAELKGVRKGGHILNLTSPSGPGKPLAEGAVTFSTNLSGG